jgi:hypothetical protein
MRRATDGARIRDLRGYKQMSGASWVVETKLSRVRV